MADEQPPGFGISHEREMGAIQQTLSGFSTKIDEMNAATALHRKEQRTRQDQMFSRLDRTDAQIRSVENTVGVLAQAVAGEREITAIKFEAAESLTRTRFQNVWRYIMPTGGAGVILGGAGIAWKYFGG